MSTLKTLRRSALFRMIVGLFLALGFSAVVIAMQGLREDVFKADAAVVFGNEVYADGSCSPRLAARLERALLLYRQGFAPRIIVSGGMGAAGADEAPAMRAYLVARGLPEKDIIVDSSGVDTRATAVFTANWMRGHGYSKVLAVSQFYHLPRACLALRAEGIPQVGSARPDYFEARDAYSLAREVPAFFAYWSKVK